MMVYPLGDKGHYQIIVGMSTTNRFSGVMKMTTKSRANLRYFAIGLRGYVEIRSALERPRAIICKLSKVRKIKTYKFDCVGGILKQRQVMEPVTCTISQTIYEGGRVLGIKSLNRKLGMWRDWGVIPPQPDKIVEIPKGLKDSIMRIRS